MRRRDSIIRGIDASALGTLAMDTLLYRRYRARRRSIPIPRVGVLRRSRHLGGRAGAGTRGQAAARARHRARRPAAVRAVLNNLTHWGFGLAAGAAYGVLIGSRRPRVWYGLPFGAAVWASGTSSSRCWASTSRSGSTTSRRSRRT